MFLPTRRNSVRGVRKQLRKIRARLPAGPLRGKLAELATTLSGKGEDVSRSGSSS